MSRHPCLFEVIFPVTLPETAGKEDRYIFIIFRKMENQCPVSDGRVGHEKMSLELEHPQSSPLNHGSGKRTSFSLKKKGPLLEAAVRSAFLPQPCLC